MTIVNSGEARHTFVSSYIDIRVKHECAGSDSGHTLLIYNVEQAKPISNFSNMPEIPESLLPVRPGEFIMVEPFGSVKLDGVTISRANSDWHPPSKSERRLMFLQFFANSMLAGSVFGHAGIFTVTGDDRLVSVSPRDTTLKREMEERAKNRLSVFRDLVR